MINFWNFPIQSWIHIRLKVFFWIHGLISHELEQLGSFGLNLATFSQSLVSDFLTLNLSEQKVVKVPNLEKELLRPSLSLTQNLDTLPAALLEILALHLRSFLTIFLTLSIFEQKKTGSQKLVKVEEQLVKSRLSVLENLDSLTGVVCEILPFQLKSFLVDSLTLSTSEWKVVKVPNFEEELVRSRLSVTKNLDFLTAVLCEILTFQGYNLSIKLRC